MSILPEMLSQIGNIWDEANPAERVKLFSMLTLFRGELASNNSGMVDGWTSSEWADIKVCKKVPACKSRKERTGESLRQVIELFLEARKKLVKSGECPRDPVYDTWDY